MNQDLFIYNTLSRKKEKFIPLNSPFVGMYVCGPTVYSDVHLGNCRTFLSFDLIYRYLLHLGYKVRYVRNITDAGHLESDADVGEDKISKKARIEMLEPMEIVQRYTIDFHKVMERFNILPPSIEPTATGHISEQIEMAEKLIEKGYGYVQNGSVYFDVEKYNKEKPYGILSNRMLEDLLSNTRDLGGQEEKRGPLDFALWIKAKPEHIMRWPSPWGEGFPGWHLECSAMSNKYLGEQFDIHGGGMDLIATHHTNEIAQSQACNEVAPANYWIHTNMLTVKGQRMGKSLGNAFLPGQLFSGDHPLLEKGYDPMAVRFFMLQSHYHSTLDFSNEALQASEKGFNRLLESMKLLDQLKASDKSSSDIIKIRKDCYDAMNDDFNSPILISHLFELSRIINSVFAGTESLTRDDIDLVKKIFKQFADDVLGLVNDEQKEDHSKELDQVIHILINMRDEAKANKNYALSDKIRNQLLEAGVILKDTKDGCIWSFKN